MIALLVAIGCALAVYLLAHPRIASGIKVLLLTAPPVAGVVWLLVEVYERWLTAGFVVAVFVVILIALIGLLAHPACRPGRR